VEVNSFNVFCHWAICAGVTIHIADGFFGKCEGWDEAEIDEIGKFQIADEAEVETRLPVRLN
jgi:hypothetical protein